MQDWNSLHIFLELTRSRGLVEAGKRLNIDHSTVSRRIRQFEQKIGTQLFERSNQGYTLTAAGHRLIAYAERAELAMLAAIEELGGQDPLLSGHVRLGTTEGFGMFLAPALLADFCEQHPGITVDLLPMPRFINMSKREADISISLDRPQSGNYVVARLTNYSLRVYATRAYLESHPPIRTQADLAKHNFAGYIDELVYTEELRYERNIAPSAFRPLRSNSIVSQYSVARYGRMLAILPCFIGQQCPELVPVLKDQINITRTFWLAVPTETRHIRRISALWDYLRDAANNNQAYFRGEALEPLWLTKTRS
ncbi:LysR family transcriptional regulator [Castellaniella sp. S9]|uniref:LysR family transcriptional regulator n=1 Tax=Castellaniella sp. S9 TaxID=2993652 RepID=UPI0022B500B1|nr:LysR family transcriptional regulator [Castellaniella sp. S9]